MKKVEKLIDKIQREKLEKRSSRTLYISDELIRKARAKCPEVPVSRIIEELLRDFIKESA